MGEIAASSLKLKKGESERHRTGERDEGYDDDDDECDINGK